VSAPDPRAPDPRALDPRALDPRAPDPRALEIAANLASVRARIARACAGRTDPTLPEPTLIVVTKTWPAADVRRLAALGVRDVGENRDQEAAPKHAEVVDLPLRWHFIGQLQSNKAASVARYADVVHSLDRPRIVAALGRAAEGAGRRITCLVQVALDPPPVRTDRGGVAPDDAPALADLIAGQEWLEVGGVMGVAPPTGDVAAAFALLARTAERVRRDHPGAVILSAGMSDDLEAALMAGATHVRVGGAILGSRPHLG